MEDKQLYLGHHLNTRWGFLTTVDYANKIGANFFQIFLASPHQYRSKRQSYKDIIKLRHKIEANRMKVVVHANFMLNFCNPINCFKHKAAIKLLVDDLKESVTLGAIGVVIHMGKQLKLSKSEAIDNYVTGVRRGLKLVPGSTIIFETGAGQGSEVCTSLFGLSKLYDRFTKEEKDRIKFCIDTCHVFAAGYDIGHPNYVDIFCNLVEDLLGWEKIACIHLNDSKTPLNSRKDRHADIGKGYIRLDGLKKFVQVCYSKNIPIVLETPCEDSFTRDKQIQLVKSWIQS